MIGGEDRSAPTHVHVVVDGFEEPKRLASLAFMGNWRSRVIPSSSSSAVFVGSSTGFGGVPKFPVLIANASIEAFGKLRWKV